MSASALISLQRYLKPYSASPITPYPLQSLLPDCQYLLENSLKRLYNQRDFIKLWWKGHTFILIISKQLHASFRNTLVQFGLYPNISKRKVPFFKSGTTHAGCNGNLGFLFSVSTLWFSFAEPRRYRLTPHMGPQDPASWHQNTWPQSGQSEVPGLAQRWSRDPHGSNWLTLSAEVWLASSHLAATRNKRACKWK